MSLCGLRLKSMFFAPIVSLLRFLFWFFSFIRCYFPLLIHSCSYFNRQFCRFSPVQFLFYALIASLLFVFSKKKESTFKHYEKCNKKNWKCVCVSINMYVNGWQPLSWKNFMCFISKIYVYVWHNNCITSDWKRKEIKKKKEKKIHHRMNYTL